MKHYFRLQAVLTIRERQERVALEKYAVALKHLRQARERLEKVEVDMTAHCESRRVLLTRGGSAAEINQSDEFSQTLEEMRRGATANLESARSSADAARQETLYRRQRREAVERYRNKQRRQHILKVSQDEQKLLDELGQLRRRVLLESPSTEEKAS